MGESKSWNQNFERGTAALENTMGTKDFERFLRIQEPAMPTTERLKLTWKVNSNQIVKLRREARREIRTMHDLIWKRFELEKQLKDENAKTFKNRFEIEHLESLVRSLNEIIKSTRDVLASLGELVTTTLEIYNLVASDHDIAQLIGANMREVEIYRKDHEERGESYHTFFTNLVFVYQAESEIDRPLSRAMQQRFMQELHKNKELGQAAKEELEKISPALKHVPRYQVHEDVLGNQVLEQVYRPLELV